MLTVTLFSSGVCLVSGWVSEVLEQCYAWVLVRLNLLSTSIVTTASNLCTLLLFLRVRNGKVKDVKWLIWYGMVGLLLHLLHLLIYERDWWIVEHVLHAYVEFREQLLEVSSSFLDLLILFYVCASLRVCVCTIGQKRVSDLLILELCLVVSHPVGIGSWTQDPCKNNQCS